jgi:FMN phosphatase YigB (HAD superfamily)
MATRWLTFDCFGTLVDWRHGIGTTGELLFPGRGGGGRRGRNAMGAVGG